MMKLALSAAFLCAFWMPAWAQSANSATPAAAAPVIAHVKMGALVSSGYEIKAVTVVPQEASSRVAQRPDKDAALVTLQKGSSVATCFLALDAYVSPGMLDIPWCIEQK